MRLLILGYRLLDDRVEVVNSCQMVFGGMVELDNTLLHQVLEVVHRGFRVWANNTSGYHLPKLVPEAAGEHGEFHYVIRHSIQSSC